MTTTSGRNRRRKQEGFSLFEVMIALVVLLAGVVGVAQMIPFSLGMNTSNRGDSTGLVIAQRELEQFLQQPIANTTYTNTINTDDPCYNVVCNLGSSATFGAFQGSPTIVVNNRTMIDFSQAMVANYSLSYRDQQDPTKTLYDVRWAVETNGQAGNIMWKRIVMSVRKDGPGAYIRPVTLDVVVAK